VTAVQLFLRTVPVALKKHFSLCSAKNFLTKRHVLSVTAFCVRIYRAGQNVSSFKLRCSFFSGIMSVVDNTNILQRPRSFVILFF
jgi:hypothetical protein